MNTCQGLTIISQNGCINSQLGFSIDNVLCCTRRSSVWSLCGRARYCTQKNPLFRYIVLQKQISEGQPSPFPHKVAEIEIKTERFTCSRKSSSRFLTSQTGHAKRNFDVVVNSISVGNSAFENEANQGRVPTADGCKSRSKDVVSTPAVVWRRKFTRLLIVLRHGLVLWTGVACITWLASSGTVRAVETTLPRFQPLSKLQAIISSSWPKFLLVVGVFRDQGLLLTLLLSFSAFFSMAETAITTLWPWKVRELAEKEGEDGVFHLLRQDVTRFLTTILIGTTAANIAATALVTDAATALFGEAGITAATAVMTVVVLLLTEIAPKSVAVHNATEVARFVVRPVAWLSVILYPVGRVVTAISTAMLKVLGLKSSGEPFVTEDELKLMLRGAELSGSIEEEEQDMIENVLEIKDTYVREVMTPLVDVVAIDAGATLLDFRNLWVKHQYSRVPVFEKRVDNIIGIAYAMDMLDYVEEVQLLQRLTVGRIAHMPAYFVPDSMSVWSLLREFRIRKVHMAIVLNEYGGTIGVTTLEDVVEEIVGEIFDENDSKEEIRKKTGYVIQRADGVFDVDANTSIEDLAEALDVKVPEGPFYYETVSGFICEEFGYIPRTGDSVQISLRKADSEESTERRDGDSDHPEDRKEKFKTFRLEILAGNARKVGSVRFEQVDNSQVKEDELVVRSFPRILKHGWKKQPEHLQAAVDTEEKGDVATWAPESNLCVPTPLEQDESNCDAEGHKILDIQLMEKEFIDAGKITGCQESLVVETVGEAAVGSEAGQLTTIGHNKPSGYESDGEEIGCSTGDDGNGDGDGDVDCNAAGAAGSLTEKWQEHEKQVERRRQRRRKQSLEAAAELHRWQKSDDRRREADKATIILRKKGDQGSNYTIENGTREEGLES